MIAAGDEVPITKYASKLIANLASEAGYPADFAAGYAANVVSKEDNVKAVVAKVELGEGDAGIVYVTDAAASSAVATIDVPDAANVPATYAGVVVKASPNLAAGRAFLTWFAGSGGRAILAGFGFLPPVIDDWQLPSTAAAGRWALDGAFGGAKARTSRSPASSPSSWAAVLTRRASAPRRVARRASSRRPSSSPGLSLPRRRHLTSPRARPAARLRAARRSLRGMGQSRPSSTCPSSCRRPSPARLLLVFGRAACSPLRTTCWASRPVPTVAVILARRRAAPFFNLSARTGLAASIGTARPAGGRRSERH